MDLFFASELVVIIISGTHRSVIRHLYQGLHGKACLRICSRSTSHPGDAGDPAQYLRRQATCRERAIKLTGALTQHPPPVTVKNFLREELRPAVTKAEAEAENVL